MKKFASGKKAFGFCDICGFRTKLRDMKEVIVKRQGTSLLACRSCWDKDHPQNMQGEYPVNDPQALRNPRPDQSLSADSSDTSSRAVDWGWRPVGSGPNMAMEVKTGTVTVTVE
jgi:ribosome-binding protein aMBF1 (putative translation factor)